MIALRLTVVAALLFTGCTRHPPEDHSALLREADRLAWLTNWTAATPEFARAEELARVAGDQRSELYAKFGRLAEKCRFARFQTSRQCMPFTTASPLLT